MSGFVIAAVLLASAAIAYLVSPLWRTQGSKGMAVATAAIILVGSGALYLRWSNFDWETPVAEGAHADEQMISRLARRMERNPEDVEGWLMLGRSHAALGQYALAQRAYRRADRLEGGRNADALLGLAETMVLESEGALDDRSSRLFEQALELAPKNERALFFSAIAARRRGETALAVTRLETMLGLNPPENVREILERELTAMRAEPAVSGVQVAERVAERVAQPIAARSDRSQVARVEVALELDPALARSVSGSDTLFVFVRAPGQPGPPLAVKRLNAGMLPLTLELTAADSMVPGVSFALGDLVEVSAKISADGNATPKSGEPIGRASYRVGESGLQRISINSLTP